MAGYIRECEQLVLCSCVGSRNNGHADFDPNCYDWTAGSYLQNSGSRGVLPVCSGLSCCGHKVDLDSIAQMVLMLYIF